MKFYPKNVIMQYEKIAVLFCDINGISNPSLRGEANSINIYIQVVQQAQL